MKLKTDNDYTTGLTCYIEQKIYLLKEQANIIKSLKHELTHVWLWEYAHTQNDKTQYDYEDICEIVASSNDFINKVVEKYKNEDIYRIKQQVDKIELNTIEGYKITIDL